MWCTPAPHKEEEGGGRGMDGWRPRVYEQAPLMTGGVSSGGDAEDAVDAWLIAV